MPILKELSLVKPEDPAKYPNREDFNRMVDISFAKASAYLELINLLEQQGIVMDKIRKQLDKPTKDWSAGNG